MRLFVGIPLAPEIQEELSRLVARLRSKEDGLRWTAPDSWHITLQFLGNADQTQFECLTARLSEIRSEPISLRLEKPGFFEQAGVFFAGVAESDELAALAKQVNRATARCGFAAEPRPFHPHITLARAKGRGRVQSAHLLKAPTQWRPHSSRFVATEFLLYESHLGQSGAKYEAQARFTLVAP